MNSERRIAPPVCGYIFKAPQADAQKFADEVQSALSGYLIPVRCIVIDISRLGYL